MKTTYTTNDQKPYFCSDRLGPSIWDIPSKEASFSSNKRPSTDQAQSSILSESHTKSLCSNGSRRTALYFHQNAPITLPPIYQKSKWLHQAQANSSIFVRDSSVTLFNASRLIPYPIKARSYQHLLGATLPASSNHFLYGEKNGKGFLPETSLAGRGFYQVNVEQAKLDATKHNIPFKQAKSCIEGGNCFLFFSGAKKKAILGVHSLSLSLMALEEAACFDTGLDQIHVDEPSDTALRLARNRVHFKAIERAELKAIAEKLDTSKREERALLYWKSLTEPLTSEDRTAFHKAGILFEKKLAITAQVIADELGLPSEDIAYLPQTDFHLDLEICVTPAGKVILQSEEKTLELLAELEELYPLSPGESSLLEDYRETAESKKAISSQIAEERRKALKEAGIAFQELPFVLEAPAQDSALNYCNGIFASNGRQVRAISGEHVENEWIKQAGFTLITTGPWKEEEKVFHEKVTKLFKKAFPNYALHGVPGLSKFVSQQQGGIHCLSFEEEIIQESDRA